MFGPLLVFALVLILTPLLINRKKEVQARSGKLPAIVRLYDVKRNAFFCTGFVVSDNMLITAAHCIADYEVLGIVFKAHIAGVEVRDLHGKKTAASISYSKADVRSDQALIVGDFSMFEHMLIATEPGLVAKISQTGTIKSCGFPYGGPLYCVSLKYEHIEDFQMSFSGDNLFPGMSGGPVFDNKSGIVIGINTGVAGPHQIISPTSNIFYNLGIAVVQ